MDQKRDLLSETYQTLSLSLLGKFTMQRSCKPKLSLQLLVIFFFFIISRVNPLGKLGRQAKGGNVIYYLLCLFSVAGGYTYLDTATSQSEYTSLYSKTLKSICLVIIYLRHASAQFYDPSVLSYKGRKECEFWCVLTGVRLFLSTTRRGSFSKIKVVRVGEFYQSDGSTPQQLTVPI